MIEFSRFVLSNGLRVIIQEDHSAALAAVNILYDVGSRDERSDKTGFAHLFEHLMFGGSKNAPDFDDPLQNAGGENNAFTNNDITNFYDVAPVENLETILWLESDRMLSLKINARSLNAQRKVVVEEFKESILDEPYGDVWHHLGELAYTVHPYRWPTIGLEPRHIEEAELADVRAFYESHYKPNNAILAIVGNVKTDEVKALVEKWFAGIPPGPPVSRNLPAEPVQNELRRKTVEANVPVDALFMAFRAPARSAADYYAADLLTDALGGGPSARLFQRLVKENRLFVEIDCYQTGTIDPGLLLVEAKPKEGVDAATAEAAIWRELETLQREPLGARELEKLKNKMESQAAFSDAGALNKAMNLSFYELLGDAGLINTEIEQYQKVTVEDVREAAKKYLRPENCSILWYKTKAPMLAAAV